METTLRAPTGSAGMTDDEFVAAFEGGMLTEDAFRHADHVRLAWVYLNRMPLLDAIRVYTVGLRRFAEASGAPGKYHETVTWAFLVLVNERLRDGGAGLTWPEFAARNPDLLRFRDGALFERYDPSILDSDLARKVFVLP
ncbi:MAG: hypothetical protein R3195_20945 [Gemmatimonadota bacterium]|nr:hypothetical protein [Gemmatimonadota bacterium]